MNKAVKIIALILLLVLWVGFMTFAIKSDFFRDIEAVQIPGFSGDKEKDPYLEIDGEKFLADTTELPEGNIRFDVKNATAYEVKIVQSGNSFDFRHNGVLTKFSGIDADWDVIFNLKVEQGYFTFDNIKQMPYILGCIFPDEDITDFNGFESSAVYFNIQVTIGDETLIVPLSGFYGDVKIELSDEYIVF